MLIPLIKIGNIGGGGRLDQEGKDVSYEAWNVLYATV